MLASSSGGPNSKGFTPHHFFIGLTYDRRNHKNGAGFTILEMVIYLGVLVLVIGTVTTLLLWVVRVNNEVYVRSELVQNVERTLSVMRNEIREAQSVYTPTTTVSQFSIETTKNPPVGEPLTYIDFFLCGTRICIKRESQLPRALTSEKIEIQSLEFTQVNTGYASSIRIAIEASYLTASQGMGTTVSLRAY